jgi:hypothetical protein
MCRSIKQLRRPAEPATPEELNAAALQFVRKISGFNKPSRANQAAFERAIAEIAAASARLLEQIAPAPKPDGPAAVEPLAQTTAPR